jgi:5-methylcytosine-specific restriction protein A
MPTARICLDCNRLYTPPPNTNTHSRCQNCHPHYLKRKPRGTHHNTPQRQHTTRFYTSTAWRKTRTTARNRDQQCTNCGTTNNLTVHHIIPIKQAPHLALHLDNLTTLCRSCHAHKSNQTRRARGEGDGGTS